LEQDGSLFVLGGRTPKQSAVPGDSVIHGDIWRSDDTGQTWTQILATDSGAWPASAYFSAVTIGDEMVVLGGQDFGLETNPFCALLEQGFEPPAGLGIDPDAPCPEFVPTSNFFNDVWVSSDGITWEERTAEAGWAGRAGLSAVVAGDAIYVMGGSQNDDSAVIGANGPERLYFNDVWHSVDGVEWTEVSESAGWSPRSGHQCEVIEAEFVCFGGFGLIENPTDVWSSLDGATWTLLEGAPWNAADPEFVRYDFDSIAVVRDGVEMILTVGGDRETFDFEDPENYLRIEDDTWMFAPAR